MNEQLMINCRAHLQVIANGKEEVKWDSFFQAIYAHNTL